MASFVIQIVILAAILVVLIIIVTQKRGAKTPYEITYRHQLIEAAIYGSPNAAIIITDAANKIVLFNTGAEKLLGYKEEEIKGKGLDVIGISLPEVILKNTPIDTEAMHRLESLIPVSLTVSDCNVGGVTHYIAIMKNIRDRKEREALIMRELTLLNEGELIAGYGSWSWDIGTNKATVTEGFNRIFENDDFVADVEYLMKKVYYLDRAEVQKVLNNALVEKKDYEIEYRVQKLDGEPVWINVKGKMFLRKNNTLEKIVGVIKEI